MAIVLNNQSQLDLALQEKGSIEAVFDIAQNNGIGITDSLQFGTELEGESVDIFDGPIKTYYDKNKVLPATSYPDIEGQEDENIGIGYWTIGTSFKVS